MRPPCGLRDPYKKMGTVGFLSCYWHGRPPLLFGERVGVRGTCDSGGGSVKKMGPVGPLSRYWHGRPPLLFGERAGVRGTCDSGGGSVHLTFCTSLSGASPVNVPGGLAASPLATPAPGKENRRFAVHSAYSFRLSGRAPACIHAGYALSARPCASPRPYGNASSIFSRTAESL
ncbi:hypothetical protein ABIE02_003226 [Leclercia sp. 1548]